MKKVFTIFVAASFLNLTVSANNPNSVQLNEKELSAQFEELNKVESYVTQNEGVTLSTMVDNHNELVQAANMDVQASQIHENINKKSMPSFSEKPWYYIGAGILIVVVVGLYILTGGEGWNSRGN